MARERAVVSAQSRLKLGVSLRRVLFGTGLVATLGALLRQFRPSEAGVQDWKRGSGVGPHPFDREFGVETGGFVGWRELQSGSANDPYISAYLGAAPSTCRRMLGLLADPADYTFVDLGCGKGRATIVASEFPFRRIIGVEIAESLAEQARANAAVIAAAFPDRPPIEIEHQDAAQFEPPPGPLALFLFQPFGRPVLRAVLDRLERSLAAHKRPAVLFYLNPLEAKLLDRRRFLHRVAEHRVALPPHEAPFSFGGQGNLEHFAVWATREPPPRCLAW